MLFDILLGFPALRKLVSYIDLALITAEKFGGVLKLNENGVIVDTVVDMKGVATAAITSVIEFKGGLYLGSLANNFVGYIPLSAK